MAARLTTPRKHRGNGDAAEPGAVSPETVLQARREITASKTSLELAQADHRNVCKRWKGQGVNTKALIEVIQIRKQEPEAAVAHFRDVFRYGMIEQAPFALQLNLFDQVKDTKPTTKAQAEHQEFATEEAGYIAGRRGFGMEGCAHQPGSRLHQIYAQGWKRGQAAIVKQMGKNAKVASATPRKKAAATGTTRANAGRKRVAPPDAAAAVAAAETEAQTTLLQ
jgi:hypothetical protein